MLCAECGGKLEVIDVVRDEDDIYRRRKCKICGKLSYSHEEFVEPDDSFRAAWNKIDSTIRNKGKEEKK